MLAKTLCFAINGLDAYTITIEADISPGLPAFAMVGLPDSAVRESRERVRAAIKNSGFEFPSGRITVNLSPADTRKEGPAFDLSIAIAILTASGQVNADKTQGLGFLGELSLDGALLPITGTLAFALAATPPLCRGLVITSVNAQEAALAGTVPVYPAGHLKEVMGFLQDPALFKPFESAAIRPKPLRVNAGLDLSDVKGQLHLKRGLEVAAAGGHNVLLIGPPGSGKTMLAKRLNGILPDMSPDEALAVTKIHSVAGLLPASGLAQHRPLRMPHHTASNIALIGGGSHPRPGEVTLAHHGILFLDELPEFDRHVLEVLRQPLEDYQVMIARAAKTMTFPAKFMLVAAMNPCPCGWRLGGKRPCRCSAIQVENYLNKISGPLLDRIDIHLEASALKTNELFGNMPTETSATVKARAARGREIQRQRFRDEDFSTNAHMGAAMIRKYCALDTQGEALLKGAVETLGLSARAHGKVLKVARTIADLDGSEAIKPAHIAEAIGYRTLDRIK